MILVTLGTQDKPFPRLLKAVEKEIKKGNIKEKVVVQAGCTKYESDCMEIFDLLPIDEFNKKLKQASFIITHGGVGNILTALNNNKKVIVVARQKKYKEHTNDHQKQIVKEFVKEGYVLELRDFNRLDKVLEKVEKFKPKKLESNNDNFIEFIEDYIEKDNHISWYNKYGKILNLLLLIFLIIVIVLFFR